MIGQRFNRLTVVSAVAHQPRAAEQFACICDCGSEVIALRTRLLSGKVGSCGCAKRENFRRKPAYGSAPCRQIREYRIWIAMRRRCLDENSKSFPDYGGAGVTVCEAWKDNFPTFLSDMGLAPNAKHTIDRIKNEVGYEPGNCRWATRTEQNRNRRCIVQVVVGDQKLCLTEACAAAGLSINTVRTRITRQGLSAQAAIDMGPARGPRSRSASRGASDLGLSRAA